MKKQLLTALFVLTIVSAGWEIAAGEANGSVELGSATCSKPSAQSGAESESLAKVHVNPNTVRRHSQNDLEQLAPGNCIVWYQFPGTRWHGISGLDYYDATRVRDRYLRSGARAYIQCR
mgnify:CR=1 FL=1